LPALTAELRQVLTSPTEPAGRRTAAAGALARLAAAGVPGADPDEWWGLADLSDERPLVDGDRRVLVSPSGIDSFGECELRWLLRRIGADPGGSLRSEVGKLIHELAIWLARPAPEPDALRAELDRALDRFNLGAPWLRSRERQHARDMLEKLLAWRDNYSGHDVLVTEASLQVEVGERAEVRGRVDWVDRDSDGRARVIDFKTGQTPTAVDRNGQLGSYQLAVEAGGIHGVPAGTPSGGAALVALGTGAAYRERSQRPLADDPDDPTWARELVDTTAAGMGGAVFRAYPGQRCRGCPVRRSCPAHNEGWQVGERDAR
ncbi:MAG: RecB family exonuclease, partial [Mycobacteriales bacterium]